MKKQDVERGLRAVRQNLRAVAASMNGGMSFTVPLPPHVGNARGHWRTQKNARDLYWTGLDKRVQAKLIPSPPAVPLNRIKAHATFYLGNLMDDDNCMARCKHFVDWLRSRGYIANDSRRNIVWAGLPEQIIDRKSQRLVLTVEPVDTVTERVA